MCGKFTQMYSWTQVHEFSQFLGRAGGGDDGDGTAPGSGSNDQETTTTPMRPAHVIRLNSAGQREAVPMRWGWPDRWASAPMDRPKHMHARCETIDTLRTFKESFANRRGIAVVRTFNEGQEVGGRTVQHVLTPSDSKPMGIAVIWDEVPTRDGELVLAFVMVTTPPCPLIATITDRMPAILPPELWPVWLGETAAPVEEVKAILIPYAGDMHMKAQAKTAPQKPSGRRRADTGLQFS